MDSATQVSPPNRRYIPRGVGQWTSLAVIACSIVILYLLPTLVYWKLKGNAYFPVAGLDDDFCAPIAVSNATDYSLFAKPLLGESGHPRVIGTDTSFMLLPRFLAADLIRVFGTGLAFGLMWVLAPVAVLLLIYVPLSNFRHVQWWSLAGDCGLLVIVYYFRPIVVTIHTLLHWMFSRPGVLLGVPENLVYSR